MNYDAFSGRIESLRSTVLRIESGAEIGGLPFCVIRAGLKSAPCRVFLSGGVHGDEPAGVETLLRFLERDNGDLFQKAQFCILPCVNPTGYLAGTRENGEGLDLNRSFNEDVPEVALVKSILGDEQFAVAIDCHEDYDGKGFYFYEGHREGANLGEQVIERVSTIGTVDKDSDPDDPPLSPGVYPISESWGTVGLAPYLLHYHAPHVYMGETPSTEWDLDRRVAAHLAVIDIALDAHIRA